MKNVFLLLALFLTILATQNLVACLDIPPNPPDVEVSGDPCNLLNPKIKIRLLDYSTYGANTGEYCACALNIPASYGQVCSAKIVYSGTSTVVNGWSFAIDPDTYFSASPDWQGFSSSVTDVIGSGIAVDLLFEVLPSPEYNCNNFLVDLENYIINAPEFVGAGGADEIGFPDHHISVLPAASVSITPSYCVCQAAPTNMMLSSCITTIDAQTLMAELEEKSCSGAKFKQTIGTRYSMTNNCYFIVANSNGTIIAYNQTGEFSDLPIGDYTVYGYCTAAVLDDTILGLNVNDPCLDIDISQDFGFSIDEICIDVEPCVNGVSSIINITGGSGNYIDISWFNSAAVLVSTGLNAFNLVADTYTIVVTDDVGNTGEGLFTLDEDCVYTCGPLTTSQLTHTFGVGLELTLFWDAVPNAQAYQLAGRKQGGDYVKVFPQTQAISRYFSIAGTPNTTYEWSVRVKCDGVWTDYALPPATFTMPAGKNNANTFDIFATEEATPFATNIYPNPAKDILHIEHLSFDTEEKVNFTISDIAGRQVMQGSLQNGTNEIDISAWNEGIYFVQIASQYHTATQKIIVAR